MSLDEQNHQISSEEYDKYIYEISKQKLPDNYAEIKEAAIAEELSNSGLKSYKLDNPQGNYEHEMELDFGYAFYCYVWLNTGSVVFETVGATSDPVLHLFHTSYPASHSWTNDDGGSGYNSKITAYITSPGYYFVLIRKYLNPSSVVGTCDLYKNGSLYTSNCAISGSGIVCLKSVTEELNWFTADLTGDSRIWIENQSGFPGKIIAYNDDWSGESDYSWGVSSRVRSNLNTNIRAVIVSCYSSYNPTGNCDLYMNCKNSSRPIPNPNDAIMSAPYSTLYNCFSWSGGRDDLGQYFTPYQYTSPWKAISYQGQKEYELYSFDNFYANRDDNGNMVVRYTGQLVMNFIREEEYSSNSCVALWSSSPYYITHASVRKPANDQPHGYDWESKDGSDERFFHPKDAITWYNTIQHYYKFSGWSSGTQPEMKSENALATVDLTDVESDLLSMMVDAFSDKTRFEELYESWKNTWDDPELVNQSNRKMFAKSEQFSTLLEYCQNQSKEVWPLIFNKYVEGEELSMLLIADVTKGEYSWLMDEIIMQQNRECARKRTPPSLRVNGLNYIAALLGEIDKLKSDPLTDVLAFDKDLSVNVYPNPAGNIVNIEIAGIQQTEVVIRICDLSGKVLKSVSKNLIGDHTFNINIEDISDGTYICKIESSNNVYTIKLNVIR